MADPVFAELQCNRVFEALAGSGQNWVVRSLGVLRRYGVAELLGLRSGSATDGELLQALARRRSVKDFLRSCGCDMPSAIQAEALLPPLLRDAQSVRSPSCSVPLLMAVLVASGMLIVLAACVAAATYFDMYGIDDMVGLKQWHLFAGACGLAACGLLTAALAASCLTCGERGRRAGGRWRDAVSDAGAGSAAAATAEKEVAEEPPAGSLSVWSAESCSDALAPQYGGRNGRSPVGPATTMCNGALFFNHADVWDNPAFTKAESMEPAAPATVATDEDGSVAAPQRLCCACCCRRHRGQPEESPCGAEEAASAAAAEETVGPRGAGGEALPAPPPPEVPPGVAAAAAPAAAAPGATDAAGEEGEAAAAAPPRRGGGALAAAAPAAAAAAAAAATAPVAAVFSPVAARSSSSAPCARPFRPVRSCPSMAEAADDQELEPARILRKSVTEFYMNTVCVRASEHPWYHPASARSQKLDGTIAEMAAKRTDHLLRPLVPAKRKAPASPLSAASSPAWVGSTLGSPFAATWGGAARSSPPGASQVAAATTGLARCDSPPSQRAAAASSPVAASVMMMQTSPAMFGVSHCSAGGGGSPPSAAATAALRHVEDMGMSGGGSFFAPTTAGAPRAREARRAPLSSPDAERGGPR